MMIWFGILVFFVIIGILFFINKKSKKEDEIYECNICDDKNCICEKKENKD